MRGKIRIKNSGGQNYHIKIRYFAVTLALLSSINIPRVVVEAVSCPDLRVVFARGSGGERWSDKNYLEYKNTIETKLKTTDLKYEFIDLDYPAVAIGLDKLSTTVGALFGAGEAYEFGDSVNAGVDSLSNLVNSSSCPNTRYVLGGYSQGAMVVSKSLEKLNANKIIYAATFGDPKIYLPEGEGLMPAACRGDNLSDYRKYVPDCQAYIGLLGAYIPYEPEALVGKVGTWCNKRDIFCSSRLSVSDHLGYIADDLYEDASRVIFDKITKTYDIKNTISSPHDTAILIDSTGSMEGMIEQYKNEALRLAEETLSSGGRVALYDYRDLDDPYTPVQHCDFNTCTLEKIQTELNNIQADGGGDTPESLLSASFHVMSSLKWKYGSTKSLVVLTDANYLSPDRDGMSFDEVVALSKKIDPVNFYIITSDAVGHTYEMLASATDGKVVTNFDELSFLTDYIMERYDTLPRVEETSSVATLPILTVTKKEEIESKITVKFNSTGIKTLVLLNDSILGMTNGNEITVSGLDPNAKNELKLVPMGEDVRGEAVIIALETNNSGLEPDLSQRNEKNASRVEAMLEPKETIKMRAPDLSLIPKTPNTGSN
ncbi:cutinase family protein [Candidatus Saccharibacteria bacterium]|nr:cutinase family protein [Candidatus Saccharibacteria bacterium]